MKLLLSTIWLLLIGSVVATAQVPDLIMTNGKVFTSDTTQLYAEALAIKGNRILAVGTDAAIQQLANAQTQRINLKGKTVVPGFNDAHDHPGWEAAMGKQYAYNDFNPAGLSRAAVLDSVARLVKTAKPGEWIQGLIGTTVLFDVRMRASLDSLSPNNPVGLQVWWGHGMVVNRKALEASGLSDRDRDPLGGWYIRDAAGRISGLQQNAQAPVWIALMNSDPAALVKGLRAYCQQQIPYGITTVQFMGTGFNAATALRAFEDAHLPQRIRIIAWPRSKPAGRQLSDWNVKKRGASLTYLSGIKYVVDGTPMEGNALRSTPYTEGGDWYGRLNYPLDTMKRILKEALSSDRQLHMHVTADSSFSVVLSLMKELADGQQWTPKRVRLEHNCVGDLSGDIVDWKQQLVKDFGILMMHTPKYCMASPLRSLLDKGITVGISPDGTTNPFVELMLVTSTHTNPKENLTMEQAVIAYTRTNAFAEFMEKEKGTLMPGMLADLAVLSQDIFAIPAGDLPKTVSELTMVGGKIVYRANHEGTLVKTGKTP